MKTKLKNLLSLTFLYLLFLSNYPMCFGQERPES